MPLYYFETLDGRLDADDLPVEMEDFDEAKSAAIFYLMDLLRDKVRVFGPNRKMNCLIRSENGQELLRLTLNMEVSDRRFRAMPLIETIKRALGLPMPEIAWEK